MSEVTRAAPQGRSMGLLAAATLALLGVGIGLALLKEPATDAVRSTVVKMADRGYPAREGVMTATFSEADAQRPRLDVSLTPVLEGLTQPTDVLWVPGRPGEVLVLEKPGAAWVAQLSSGEKRKLMELPVLTNSEQGLLGAAFHPKFAENGRFFFNYVLKTARGEVSRVSEWTVQGARRLGEDALSAERVVMEIVQPYPNHNAGGLVFGPDGMLYVGWGDGGWRDDPQGHGQDLSTLLGSMLRIDVDRQDPGRAYAIPADNPLVGQEGAAPETFAWGLRNPWRYSFAPDGRLIVADVGQNSFEEINVVVRGGNYGWNVREARHCFKDKPCQKGAMIDPFYEYGRGDGASITGGHVYTGARVPALKGRYVFGDFVSGRIWALDLPPTGTGEEGTLPTPTALGRWPMLISTFARDPEGELYVVDFGKGVLYRIDPPAGATSP